MTAVHPTTAVVAPNHPTVAPPSTQLTRTTTADEPLHRRPPSSAERLPSSPPYFASFLPRVGLLPKPMEPGVL
ncbi:hypothetical protein VPH35_126063 [Triticum aestivum]